MPESGTDAARLARLRRSMGSEFGEFVGIFARESSKRLAELESAFAADDAPAARKAAHALRSSAGWVGLSSLAETLGAIEEMPEPVDRAAWEEATREARALRERGMTILRSEGHS